MFQGTIHHWLAARKIIDHFVQNILVLAGGFACLAGGSGLLLGALNQSWLMWGGMILLSLAELLNMPLLDFNISTIHSPLVQPNYLRFIL